MRRPDARSRVSTLLLLTGALLSGVPAIASADDGIGTGPAVDIFFVATSFEVEGQPDAVFVAWRDDQANIHSGLLRLDDGSFVGFPTQATPEGYVSNLAAGAGGPPDDRRGSVVTVRVSRRGGTNVRP